MKAMPGRMQLPIHALRTEVAVAPAQHEPCSPPAGQAVTPPAPPPARSLLPDGRVRLRDGGLEVVLGIEGLRPAVGRARDAAAAALAGLEAALAPEMPLLRRPLLDALPTLHHPVACRMVEATWPHRTQFITPMAAFSGAVAEHLLHAIAAVPGVEQAHVNLGGDIALHLAPGTAMHVGMPSGLALLHGNGEGVRGIATSGWRGRSFSRGIADAVTVLAAHAPEADAAATLIANAVDVDHPAVRRAPATSLDPASDLLDLSVTVAVDDLPPGVVAEALDRGEAAAQRLLSRGLILGACLRLQDGLRLVGAADTLAALDRAAG